MAFEPELDRREVLLAGAVLGMACASGACTTAEEPPVLSSIRYADAALEEGFLQMRERVSPADRAVLDTEILSRKDLLIHIVRAKLPKDKSRGGASAPHLKAEEERWCSRSQHPDVKGARGRRNWDLVYDGPRTEEWEKESGIYNKIDALLYHEIFGHILPILRNPGLYDVVAAEKQRYDAFEDEARVIENRYRSYRGLSVVPAVLPRRVKP